MLQFVAGRSRISFLQSFCSCPCQANLNKDLSSVCKMPSKRLHLRSTIEWRQTLSDLIVACCLCVGLHLAGYHIPRFSSFLFHYFSACFWNLSLVISEPADSVGASMVSRNCYRCLSSIVQRLAFPTLPWISGICHQFAPFDSQSHVLGQSCCSHENEYTSVRHAPSVVIRKPSSP
jgi:hypothetical protein